jgi:hypothetical protein
MTLTELVPRTAFQWFMTVGGNGFVLAYFDANKSFNQGSWFGFFECQQRRGEADVQLMRIREYPAGAGPDDSDPSIRVRKAIDQDLRMVSDLLLDRYGTIAYEALDYAPDRVLLSDFKATSEGRLLERTRKVFIAEDEWGPLGLGIAEYGAPGLSIFGLYDTSEIAVIENRADRTAVSRSLLTRIGELYHSVGRTSFLLLEPEAAETISEQEPQFAARAVRAIIPSRLVAEWANYLGEIWGDC